MTEPKDLLLLVEQLRQSDRRWKALALAVCSALILLLVGGLFLTARQLAARGREAAAHEARVRDETEQDIFRVQEVVSKGRDRAYARMILATRKAILERENLPALAGMYDRTARMLADVEKDLLAR